MRGFRFQTKLTLVFLALFLVVEGVIVIAFYDTVTKNVATQVQDQLSASTRVFRQIIDERIVALGKNTKVLARDDGFRSVIAPAFQTDLEELLANGTVKSALQNFGQRIESDLALIYDLDNNLIAAAPSFPREISMPLLSDDLKEQADAEGVAYAIVQIRGRIYELVLVPVRAPDIVAWLALGIEFDETAAQEIKALSSIGLEIAFIYEDDKGFKLASTTSDKKILEKFVKGHIGPDTGTNFRRSYAGEEHMFRHIALVEKTK